MAGILQTIFKKKLYKEKLDILNPISLFEGPSKMGQNQIIKDSPAAC